MPLDSHNDPRYGCPCTAHETADNSVKLYFQSGPSIFNGADGTLDEDLNQRYTWRTSADGETSWTPEGGSVSMNGRDHLATLTIMGGQHGQATPPATGQGDTSRIPYVAGYEARRGRVCFAYSTNGREFYNLDNNADRLQRGLNDDCLTAPGAAGSNSVLARAAPIPTLFQSLMRSVRGAGLVS